MWTTVDDHTPTSSALQHTCTHTKHTHTKHTHTNTLTFSLMRLAELRVQIVLLKWH